jgi:hypothetical protein
LDVRFLLGYPHEKQIEAPKASLSWSSDSAFTQECGSFVCTTADAGLILYRSGVPGCKDLASDSKYSLFNHWTHHLLDAMRTLNSARLLLLECAPDMAAALDI